MTQKPRATFAQLSSSVYDGVTVAYSYDAAGRLIRAGELSYRYNAGGRVSEVRRNGAVVASFTYHPSGQLATVIRDGKTESYRWNGLALDSRNGVEFLNEPSITGGNPAGDSGGRVYYNDRLGNTLAIIDGDMVELVETTAFGEPLNAAAEQAFFTGKPYIKELGYVFLMRNYRPELGRWQTADPIGYPDGWNQFAYCNNMVTVAIDLFGAKNYVVIVPGGDILDDAETVHNRYWKEVAAARPGQDITVIEASSLRDGKVQLSQYISQKGPIDNLVIAGHGQPGAQEIGTVDSYVNRDEEILLNCNNASAFFEGISFASNAVIDLYGCEVGQDGTVGNLLQKISEITKSLVLGSTKDVECKYENGVYFIRRPDIVRYKNGVKE